MQPTDTTGADDAFTGVFAIVLLEGRDPVEAAAWGAAAANLTVTGYGSKPAYPPLEQVASLAERLLRDARNLSLTKASIVNSSKGLAKQLVEKGIRVNAVAPGPFWTPCK